MVEREERQGGGGSRAEQVFLSAPVVLVVVQVEGEDSHALSRFRFEPASCWAAHPVDVEAT